MEPGREIEKAGIKFGIVPIPMPEGGAAPGPMGGEVLTIPLTDNAEKMAAAGKLVNCLLSDKNMLAWADQNTYVPGHESVAQQVADRRTWRHLSRQPRRNARALAHRRTFGPNYSKVSQPLWNAIQAALTGAKTPEQALKDAQQQAESATK